MKGSTLDLFGTEPARLRVFKLEYGRKPNCRVTLLAGDYSTIEDAELACEQHDCHVSFTPPKQPLNVNENLGKTAYKARWNVFAVFDTRTGDVLAISHIDMRGHDAEGSA